MHTLLCSLLLAIRTSGFHHRVTQDASSSPEQRDAPDVPVAAASLFGGTILGAGISSATGALLGEFTENTTQTWKKSAKGAFIGGLSGLVGGGVGSVAAGFAMTSGRSISMIKGASGMVRSVVKSIKDSSPARAIANFASPRLGYTDGGIICDMPRENIASMTRKVEDGPAECSTEEAPICLGETLYSYWPTSTNPTKSVTPGSVADNTARLVNEVISDSALASDHETLKNKAGVVWVDFVPNPQDDADKTMRNFLRVKAPATANLNSKIWDTTMIGAHDALMSECSRPTGCAYAKTQKLNLKQQAEAGVTMFDVRLTLSVNNDLMGYHPVGVPAVEFVAAYVGDVIQIRGEPWNRAFENIQTFCAQKGPPRVLFFRVKPGSQTVQTAFVEWVRTKYDFEKLTYDDITLEASWNKLLEKQNEGRCRVVFLQYKWKSGETRFKTYGSLVSGYYSKKLDAEPVLKIQSLFWTAFYKGACDTERQQEAVAALKKDPNLKLKLTDKAELYPVDSPDLKQFSEYTYSLPGAEGMIAWGDEKYATIRRVDA